ncbi:MAG: hypothetical protein J5379_06165, partial [Clostridiales bacterium]|nr:hypothetical protein [Clostridiales bacterium]
MKNLFRNKKFVGITSLVLATSLVVGTIAVRRSKNNKGLEVGVPVVYAADGNLLDYDSASLVNFSTILGRSVDYGILSQTLIQAGHMETTFATNKFVNPGADNNCDVDLAGSATAQFIITSLEPGSVARFGNTYASSTMNFVIDTTYDMAANEDTNFRYDTACKASVLYRTYDEDVLRSNVDSMINKVKKQSGILAAKPAFDGDEISEPRGDKGATIDLSDPSFRDATIYINVKAGSRLETAIGVADGLLIKKHPSTNVVFNMLGGGDITLSQYRMQIVDETFTIDTENGKEHSDYSFDSTTTCSGEDSLHNKHVDEYMTRSIIWNVRNASSVKYNMTAGLFLIPNDIPSNVVGSSAGWIASAGTTTVSSGEFHYIYHDREDKGNTVDESVIHFAARKAFTDDFSQISELTNVKLQANQYSFSFVETEKDFKTEKPGGVKDLDCRNDQYSKIVFPNITVDVATVDPNIPQRRYFVVKENDTPAPTDSNVSLSSGEIDIEMVITNVDGIIHYVINTYKYYEEKNGQAADEIDSNVPASGAEFSLGAFYNKYDAGKGKITLRKTLDGAVPSGKSTYQVAVKKGMMYLQNDTGLLDSTEHYFDVPADGSAIEISNLLPGEYTVIENEGNLLGYNLTDTKISVNTTVEGNTSGPVDISSDGKVTLPKKGQADVTVTNTYEEMSMIGKASITVEKKIKIGDTVYTADTLPDEFVGKEYKFQLWKVGDYEATQGYIQDYNGTLETSPKNLVVKAGEKVTIYGLEVGANYRLFEILDSGDIDMNSYALVTANGLNSSQYNDAYNYNTHIDNLAAGEQRNLEMVNEYTPLKGSITVSKVFERPDKNPLDANQISGLDLSNLTITISGPAGFEPVTLTGAQLQARNWTWTQNDVPLGDYTITETGAEGSSSEAFQFVDCRISGTSVQKYNPGSYTITNVYKEIKYGRLTIEKTVSGVPGIREKLPDGFKFYILNEDGEYYDDATGKFTTTKKAVTIVGDGNFVTQPIPEGKYTVVEDLEAAKISGYEMSVEYKIGDKIGNIVDLKQSGGTCKIKNIYAQNWIEVSKVETGDHMYDNWTYYFSIQRVEPNGSVKYVDANGDLVNLESGAEPYYFSVKAGHSTKVMVTHPGEYKVVEKDEGVAANNAYSLDTTYSPADGAVRLDPQTQSAAVTITNDYTYLNKGDLVITKTVTGDTNATEYNAGTEFDVLVTLDYSGNYVVESSDGSSNTVSFTAGTPVSLKIKAGETLTIKGIIAGTGYTVAEDTTGLTSGYTLPADGILYSNTNKEISKGNTDTVDITNNYEKPAPDTGSIKLQKTVGGDVTESEVKNGTLTFTVTTVKNGTTYYVK